MALKKVLSMKYIIELTQNSLTRFRKSLQISQKSFLIKQNTKRLPVSAGINTLTQHVYLILSIEIL